MKVSKFEGEREFGVRGEKSKFYEDVVRRIIGGEVVKIELSVGEDIENVKLGIRMKGWKKGVKVVLEKEGDKIIWGKKSDEKYVKKSKK